MWALDVGRVNGAPAAPNATKLVKFSTDDGTLLDILYFPPDIAPPSSEFVNDIVVLQDNASFIITDTGMPQPGQHDQGALITYNATTGEWRRVLANTAPTNPDPNYYLTIEG